eukprot:CAMPEP_0185769000 /NCGR_PEP_ID=MMETSP1174-20130828/53306_1 /TAXON_ID=35687 /ORGANISM="Dictyocha speculum, Strain CCMP1381" /LENGTH=59 /DNA_ID=CAMNT_0028453927 /DNA_START=279 /DNA_END=455 /DNA_ORIENTATION=+
MIIPYQSVGKGGVRRFVPRAIRALRRGVVPGAWLCRAAGERARGDKETRKKLPDQATCP